MIRLEFILKSYKLNNYKIHYFVIYKYVLFTLDICFSLKNTWIFYLIVIALMLYYLFINNVFIIILQLVV